MSDGKLVSVLDFGSSKIRLGIFKDYLSNSKFISEIESKENLNQNLQKIVRL